MKTTSFSVLFVVFAFWQPSKSQEKNTEDRAAKIAKRDTARTDAEFAADRGDERAAARTADAALALDKELFGADSQVVTDRSAWAQSVRELAKLAAKHGKTDWRVVGQRVQTRYADQIARLAPKDRAALDELEQLSTEADELAEAGRFAEASAKLTAALAIGTRTLGATHFRNADLLIDHGWLYYQARALSKAEPLLKRACELHRAAFGAAHPRTVGATIPLAVVYRNSGKPEDAQKIYDEAERVLRTTSGTETRMYATVRSNGANVLSDLGRQDEAVKWATEGIAIERRLKVPESSLAVSINNLAMVYREMKRYDEAEPLFLEAVRLNKKGLRATHPDYAHSIHNLAANYFDKGEKAKAGPLFREALDVILQHTEAAAAMQSESDQLASASRLRFYLNSALFASEKDDPKTVYEQLYRARGVITVRQTLTRAAASGDKSVQALLAQLRDTSRRMSGLVSAGDDKKATAEYQKLAAARDKLEAELAEKSTPFRSGRLSSLGKLSDLQAALPEGAVLVDYVQHHDKLTAFVVTKKSVARVAIGDVNPVAEAVEQMRDVLDRTGYAVNKNGAARALRKAVWDPLGPHLKGAKHVLICPDGPLCRLPFAVLPGAAEKTYLLEDVALSVVAVPQLLPQLLSRPRPAESAPASFLAVGGVNFDAALAPGAPTSEFDSRARAGGALAWKALPGTTKELEELTKLVRAAAPKGALTTLSGNDATEAAVRAKISGATHVHFATHGFFAGADAAPKSLVPQRRLGDVFRDPMLEYANHPGLTTGIVLAGANKPRGENDGVLTALEVGDLDLAALELVVLSACETGLGKAANGEGALGLQRAFQVAGARATVTTLWQIPDHATQLLMGRFYQNLWRGKMSRLEALRDAQLWMLKEGRADPELTRGMKRVDLSGIDDTRLPPLFWGAFVLSGDWR